METTNPNLNLMFGSKEVLRQGKNVKENNFLTFGLMWKI